MRKYYFEDLVMEWNFNPPPSPQIFFDYYLKMKKEKIKRLSIYFNKEKTMKYMTIRLLKNGKYYIK